MKKIYIKIILTLTIVLIAKTAFADTNIHLTINTPTNNFFDGDINVAPCDTDNQGTQKITPYCAIKQTGLVNTWTWYGTSAFLDSLNGISGFTTYDTSNNPVYHYWSWYLNGNFGMTALNEYELIPNDVITISFIDPKEDTPIFFSGSSINTPIIKEKKKFNNINALNFLISKQEKNGSFVNDLYTDWVAIALSSSDSYSQEKEKLKEYFSKIETKDWSLTDYERHSIALMSLGINPYNFNKINYIENIIKEFDGKQFGNPFYVNDDIFALIVLKNAGFTKDEIIIKNTTEYILSKQYKNGSWEGNIDLTGAAIISLIQNKEDDNFNKSIEKAKEYILNTKRENGSFGNNISSTAWALQGLLILDNDYDISEQSNYFAENQGEDGGIKEADTNSRIWETAYATSISEGKTWDQLMQKFEKPTEITTESPLQTKIEIPKIKNKITKENIIPTTINTIDQPTLKKNWWKRFWEVFGI